MKIFDQIAMCLQNLSRRKVRTALTTMGVVIGTCAIVVMISLGVGLQKSQEAMLAQMGDLTKIEITIIAAAEWKAAFPTWMTASSSRLPLTIMWM